MTKREEEEEKGGTHILYVRYIILLHKEARQAEQREQETTREERWRVKRQTGRRQAAGKTSQQKNTHTHTQSHTPQATSILVDLL